MLSLSVFVAAGGAASRAGDVTPSRTANASPDECHVNATPPAYGAGVMRALRGRRDLWGERLLRQPGGPTYASAARFLRPLLLAGAPGRTLLTDSGVYYLPFGVPDGARGTSGVALHVADGSQVVSRRVGGDSLTVQVGATGGERYGSCVARLTPAHLADGWLPIAQTVSPAADTRRFSSGKLPGR